jgi:hypothetical protein
MNQMSELERLKCSIFSSRVMCVTIILIILCMCLCMISIPEADDYYEQSFIISDGPSYSNVRCPPMDTHEFEKQPQPIPSTLPPSTLAPVTVEPKVDFIDLRGGDVLETEGQVIEGFSDMTVDESKDDYSTGVQGKKFNRNGVKYGNDKTQITRKFELVAKTNESNTAMNLLFGEGEFIFTKEKLNVFMMASLYTIGANLYAVKDADKMSKLHYNVYIGDSNKNLKGKLGEMRRSLDQRYKLELVSKSDDFIKFVAENSYIVVKLEDSDGTLRQTLLESFY